MSDLAYAMDRSSPVRFIATELERAPSGALSLDELAETYHHPNSGDVSRAKQWGGVDNERDAYKFILKLGIEKLQRRGKGGAVQLVQDEDGRWRFADGITFDDLRVDNKKLVRNEKGHVLDEYSVRAMLRMETSSYEVAVVGKARPRRLRIHPMSDAFPKMSDEEFAGLARSVYEEGVIEPLLVHGDQVLDGRHRLLAAVGLKKPVPIREFAGDDEQAGKWVWALNVERRHLNTAQKGLLTRQFHLPQAEKEAAERQRETLKKGNAPVSANLHEREKATEVAAKRSGTGVSPRTVATMAPVDDAPQTQERIRNGEITTATAARKAALEEKGKPVTPPEKVPPKSKSVYDRLGLIATNYRHIINGGSTHDGQTDPIKFAERLDEIEELHRQVMAKLRS